MGGGTRKKKDLALTLHDWGYLYNYCSKKWSNNVKKLFHKEASKINIWLIVCEVIAKTSISWRRRSIKGEYTSERVVILELRTVIDKKFAHRFYAYFEWSLGALDLK